MGRVNKTGHYSGWGTTPYLRRELSRSFDTLEAAQKFAEGKEGTDIFRSHGKFKVVWFKTIELDAYGERKEGANHVE